ncbi:response regulator [candidate division WOR-3 bacterium]|nr:response regulator [candidate division WOR-3 bacterium]
MKEEVVVLVAEDDEAHAALIQRNLKRAGIGGEQLRFSDGQQTLDFLQRRGDLQRTPDTAYLLLLDIKMPKVDGVEVLRRVKLDPELKKLPVVMVTTTDDPREVARCHELGCSCYLSKPVEYERFADAVRRLGEFLAVVEMPTIGAGA